MRIRSKRLTCSRNSDEKARRIMRRPSSDIEAILGFSEEPELIHRDNLVLR